MNLEILLLIITIVLTILNILLFLKINPDKHKDYLAHWNILEKSIEINLKLYDTIVNYELNDYDTSTETYAKLKAEFVSHVINILQGTVVKESIKFFYGNESNFMNYLNDRFDNSYYKKYLSIEPVINERI